MSNVYLGSSGGSGIKTINNISPNGSGNFTLESTDSTVSFATITNGLNLSVSSALDAAIPIGSISYFPANATPGSQWLQCNGQVVSQSSYPTLYSQIGLLGGPDTIPTTQTTALINTPNLMYANSLYIMSGTGLMQTSTDAITWSEQITNQIVAVANIKYFNSLYIGETSNGVVTSTNLQTWTAQTLTNFSGTPIIATNGTNVSIVSTAGWCVTSTNGSAWSTAYNIGAGTIVSNVTGNGGYGCCGTSNFIYTSTDGNTWYTTCPAAGNGMSYGSGVYNMIGANTIQTSTNGTLWSPVNFGNTTSSILACGYGNSIWLAGGNGGLLYYSSNGSTFTSVTSSTTSSINAICYGSSLWVIGGNGGAICTSTLGSSAWTVRTSGTTSSIFALVYGANYVYAGIGGVLASSTNGTTWSAKTSGTSSQITCLAYSGSIYAYGTVNGGLASSTDATTWSVQTSPITATINCMSYGGGIFFAGNTLGTIITSTDGVTWVQQPTQNVFGGTSIKSCYYDGTLYWASIGTGICSSTNAISWVNAQNNTTNYPLYYDPQALIWGTSQNLWVIAGNIYFATSTDLLTITNQSQPTLLNGFPSAISSAAYGNSKYFAVVNGSSGNIFSSTNGTFWVRYQMPIANSANTKGVVYGTKLVITTASNAVSIYPYNNIATFNTTYSYSTSTQFQLPTDAEAYRNSFFNTAAMLFNEGWGNVPLNLWIKAL